MRLFSLVSADAAIATRFFVLLFVDRRPTPARGCRLDADVKDIRWRCFLSAARRDDPTSLPSAGFLLALVYATRLRACDASPPIETGSRRCYIAGRRHDLSTVGLFLPFVCVSRGDASRKETVPRKPSLSSFFLSS